MRVLLDGIKALNALLRAQRERCSDSVSFPVLTLGTSPVQCAVRLVPSTSRGRTILQPFNLDWRLVCLDSAHLIVAARGGL